MTGAENHTKPRKLVLIDAYSLLFRAFYAGRPLTTRDNRPTGALYGFAGMLFSLLRQENPDAVVVCWDAAGPTFREQEFDAYKAHRPEVDPQLRAQLPVARDLVAAFGIPSAEVPGYEADDLIGTLARKGTVAGYDVVIFTGDSDQLQLVDEGIRVQMTQRGVTDVRTYDRETVRQRYGIEPERIPDWKALVGDTSDNIPGVPGIGAKTATALLQQWGTLENLLAHVQEVTPPRIREALETHREQAHTSKRLATIHCDVPGDFEIEPYAPTTSDWQRLRQLFLDLEFQSLLPRIPGDAVPSSPVLEREAVLPEARFQARTIQIESANQLQVALQEVAQSSCVAFCIETDTPDAIQAQWRAVAFAPSGDTGYYLPIRLQPGDTPGASAHPTLADLFATEEQPPEGFTVPVDALRSLLASPGIALCGHNVKFARIVMERAGLRPPPFMFDTQIAAYLLEPGRAAYPLIDLAERYLAQRFEPDDAFTPGETLAQEAALIHALVPVLRERLQQNGLLDLMERVELPLVPVLSAIERTGLAVDTEYLTALSARLNARMQALAEEIYALAGERFNISSPKQLQVILFEKLGLPHGKKTKTGLSTGADLLEQLAPEYEIARKILDYRELAKLKATYADALVKLVHPRTGRVHTSLNQTVTSTGRLSSSEPNLQNIPVRSEVGREIRAAFIAPPGKVLLSCDYSQIELRVLAHITRDPALVQAFAADEDIHAATAARVFGVPLEAVTPEQRRQAKTINFAVIYGQSGFSLGATLGVDTKTANAWIKEYFERLPGVKQYVEETIALAHRQKYVTTLLGRLCYLPELDSGNRNQRLFAERAAVNMPIQGSAADIMKLAMIAVYDYLQQSVPSGCLLLLQVHDELLFEVDVDLVPTVTPEIQRRMEQAFPLSVPLKVEAKVGPNWADMTPLSPQHPAPLHSRKG
ncbi:MAG: DNA polymerase I [Chloroherpetonaceae bacterium]|nr:DNA polymerase I [Chloroherpetonaceae bacterium]